jgi:hypothetical protein
MWENGANKPSERQDTSNRLTAWRRVLPEKLTGPQLAKKFPVVYGTRRFITAFTHSDES